MLLYELNHLFSDVVYPGDKALADSYPNEWEFTLRNLQGKNWRSVKGQDFDSQGGIIEGVQALGLKGFIYFLPGLVHICLTDADSRYIVTSALLNNFTIPDYLPESVATLKKIMAALSPARRSFMARFFSSMREAEPTLCPIVVDSAVFNLTVGDIVPYKHEDVKKWAAQFA
ncbi:MAG: hypothetical protein ACXWC8_06015 [Limisphaerales bacterium]